MTKDIFIGFGSPFWGNSLGWSALSLHTGLSVEFIPFYYKILPSVFSFYGFFACVGVYALFINTYHIQATPRAFYHVFNFLSKKWYFDKVYNEWIVQYALSWGYHVTYKSVDRGILEIFGPTQLYKNLSSTATRILDAEPDLPFQFIRYFVFSVAYIAFVGTAAIAFGLPFECIAIFVLCSFIY
jgi:NADH-ubiquinone oxidoreductase chain 5